MSAGTIPGGAGPADGFADLTAVDRRRQQRAWNWYDWANSAYYTTVLSVMFGPYLATVAGRAAGCASGEDPCSRTVSVLGIPLAAGSLPLYVTTFATIVSAFLLPVVGAFVDRSPRKKMHMAWTAWAGAFFCALLFFVKGDDWQLGVVTVVLSSVLAGCSLVSYYAILVDISTEEERDGASSRGWAWGYLGGGILLALNLVLFLGHRSFGVSEGMAVRVSLLSAGLWWAGFTIIPVLRLRNYAPRGVVPARGTLVERSFGQLITTLRELRAFPMTLTFLVAYLFYNDGIQTVLYAAAIYGDKQLHLSQTVLIATILMIQFVAFGGALFFGRMAARHGAYRLILTGVLIWMVVVIAAMFLPARNAVLFAILAIVIGVVMGGTQALSRSFFSLLIPRGREGEYFALYNAAERGTSWFGMLLFGLVFQFSGSYRPAVAALVVFFVLGAVFLRRLDPEQGIREAGNAVPGAA
ncbi:MFS transporter [Nocardioides terrisoli]|uniref:MFS transporter n=1 Tax=Nocardioides terrisoli TaxID=3388267 RepID=UPI00287BB8CE|nr:MFS transporter [Nocardioides marmorisolisilvae]